MSFTVEFEPWKPFRAHKNTATIRSWLQSVADASERAFKTGASRPWPGMGPWDFETPGSKPGEWPMRRSGNLLSTIETEVSDTEMTIGSSANRAGKFDYSIWLRKTGRKMSPEALQEGMKSAHLGHWVEWKHI